MKKNIQKKNKLLKECDQLKVDTQIEIFNINLNIQINNNSQVNDIQSIKDNFKIMIEKIFDKQIFDMQVMKK